MKTKNHDKPTAIYVIVEKGKEDIIRYVGKTIGLLKHRLHQHISVAKSLKGKKKVYLSKWLTSVNYNVSIIQIDYTESWSHGEELEKFYIKKFKLENHPLCNLTPGGDGRLAYGKYNPNAKKVIQYDKKGNFLSIFDSRADAEKITGVKQGLICGCVNTQRILSAGGYIWKKYEEFFPLKITPYEEVSRTKEGRTRIKTMVKIYQYDKNMNFIKEYKSVREAARENALQVSNLRKASLGKASTCGGFYWKREKY